MSLSIKVFIYFPDIHLFIEMNYALLQEIRESLVSMDDKSLDSE